MDHLAAALRRGGIKDLLAFFPPNKRQDKNLEEHFRAAGIPQVADRWLKTQTASQKDEIVKLLKDMIIDEVSNTDVSI